MYDSCNLYASFQALNSLPKIGKSCSIGWASCLNWSPRQIACDTILEHRNDTKPWESEFCHTFQAGRCNKHCWQHSVPERPGAWLCRHTGRGVSEFGRFAPKLLNLCYLMLLVTFTCRLNPIRYTTDDGKEYFHNARSRARAPCKGRSWIWKFIWDTVGQFADSMSFRHSITRVKSIQKNLSMLLIGINKQDAVGTSNFWWGGLLSRLSILWWLGYFVLPHSCIQVWLLLLVSEAMDISATALDGTFLHKGASLKSQHFGCSWPRFWCAAARKVKAHTFLILFG